MTSSKVVNNTNNRAVDEKKPRPCHICGAPMKKWKDGGYFCVNHREYKRLPCEICGKKGRIPIRIFECGHESEDRGRALKGIPFQKPGDFSFCPICMAEVEVIGIKEDDDI